MAKRGRKRKIVKFKLKKEVVYNLLAIFFLVLSLILLLGNLGLSGSTLNELSILSQRLFGFGRWFFLFSLIISGLYFLRLRRLAFYLNHLIGAWTLFLTTVAFLRGGRFGRWLWHFLSFQFSSLVALIISLSGLVLSLMLLFDLTVNEFSNFGWRFIKLVINPFGWLVRIYRSLIRTINQKEIKKEVTNQSRQTKLDKVVSLPKIEKTEISSKLEKNKVTPELDLSWSPPDLSLISLEVKKPADRGDIGKNKKIIEETLASFGIKARVVRVNEGAAVTLYALEIAAGTKVSKIISLQNNLALALAAPQGRIRMQVPIPGESLIGIEVPNKSLELVPTSEVIASPAFQNSTSKLIFSLGKSVDGRLQVADLAEMPHLLVAGATGSGKSVFLNNLIVSLLYKASPQELKMILVDPKRVELTLFRDLPYLITPVIKDADKVLAALNWSVEEMKQRYKQLSEVGVRNIEEYHKLMGNQEMPYLVIVIDELAQVMLFSPNEVEKAITQLAQMARAVGIHLILATQRPSVDIITGLIKANIPARISFYVTSGVDSKVILDTPGAEKLLGKGDMLFLPPDKAAPQRIQGAYISTAEVRNVTNYIRENYRQYLKYQDEVISAFISKQNQGRSFQSGVSPELRQAMEVAINEGEISISLLQRKLRIGYNKAARLVEEMEERGWLEKAEIGKKRRKVLLTDINQIEGQ